MQEIISEKIKSPEKDKKERKTYSDRRGDRLEALKAKHRKALSAQEEAEKKTKGFEDKINQIEAEIHNEKISQLDKLCSDNNITYDDVISFISEITAKTELKKALEFFKANCKEA